MVRSKHRGRPESRSHDKAPLVLIADDFADTREIYAACLRFAGFRVALAADGEEALALATSLSPDLVVMDLAMPKMDGWEATRRLKRQEATRSIPVMAISGHVEPESQRAARLAGCDAVFAKPMLPQQLVERVRALVDSA